MTRILTVEDDPIIQADIVRLLHLAGYTCEKANTVAEALDRLKQAPFDLYLLDIDLGEGPDGIGLGAEIRKLQPAAPIIFVTSYYDPPTLAKVQALHPDAYMVKPFEEHTLKVNVELALYKNRHQPALSGSDRPSRVFVRHKQELVAIQPSDILYLEADDSYAFVHTSTGKYYLTHTMKSMEEKLVGMGFQRIHKSFVVNLDKVSSIQEGYVFIDSIKLPLGRKFRQEFLQALTIL